ncbi:hypothetical protein LB465_13140 [Salegentibacter sp. LM13S]|uniref:hypothetical protein n=1 Tax=Salegentibacter lacus TaxID=2873599 RepID=UPI001CC95181|nr:hypothetical protein [Salegentibacter lacus]MBZ9631728.1 hypothetical protein [Salegentibacter lacus]
MKKVRGKELDLLLIEELNKMIESGYNIAPISRSTVQRRLGLTSRGTLALPERSLLIENAKNLQMKNAGLSLDGKKKRNGLKEQNDNLKRKIEILEKERDALIEKMAMIINGAQARGYDVEEIMMPLIN